MLAKEILKRARYSLSDMNAERWSDARLLSLLTDALLGLVRDTTLFQDTVFVGISNNVVDYDISAIAFRIERIEYLDVKLDFKSFEEMDRMKASWQLDKGDKPVYIIPNKQREACFKVYPIVENAENSHIQYSSLYGITTYISYSDIEVILANSIGEMSSLGPAAYMKVYFTRKHEDVTDINQEIFGDMDLLREPLKSYIVGYALRDNSDTQSRNMANEELAIYQALMDRYSREKANSFVKAPRQTSYNPMGT